MPYELSFIRVSIMSLWRFSRELDYLRMRGDLTEGSFGTAVSN